VRNRDVLRQGTVMGAQHGVPGVRTPAVRFSDAGTPLDVPPFVAMQKVPGECVEPLLDAPLLDAERPRDHATRTQNRAGYLNAARMLGHLHRVSPAEVGLNDEPVMSIADEIDRWTTAFGTAAEELQGDYHRCADALHRTIPAPSAPTISHVDYRLGNTLCEGDEVTALINWEIWSGRSAIPASTSPG
jgi:aminoglycoside phosphotransferase (APT) family kinase protein